MNRKFHLTILLLLCISFSLYSQSITDLKIKAGAKSTFGHTTYDIEFGDEFGKGYSQLKFPLCSIMPGAKVGFNLDLIKNWTLAISSDFYINIINPYLPMIDQDWAQPYGFPKLLFSYTESDAELFNIVSHSLIGLNILETNDYIIYLNAGYRFQYIKQDIIGYEGWQLNFETADTKKVAYDEIALLYTLTSHAIILGARLDFTYLFDWEMGLNYMFIFIGDTDDHLLRYKRSSSSGTGHGMHSSINAILWLGDKNKPMIPFISFEASLIYIWAPIKEVQEYLIDFPETPYDDTGTFSEEIDHTITSLQYDFGIYIGFPLGL